MSAIIILPSSNKNRKCDYIALGFLFLFMIVICSLTWQKWGSLTIDCGREMYVPTAINNGMRLYFDIWYPYGPLIPYWNAFLFRVFGTHLSVLYTSGITIVVIIALTLYSLSRVFLPVCLSFTAVFAFILQAFQISIFNYILPYSYPAAYGSMFLIVLLGLLIHECFEEQSWRMFSAGLISGLILLTKIEFGIAAYALLVAAITIRVIRTASVRRFANDIVFCLPGFLLSIGIYASVISDSSFAFIFEENITIAPQSYFVKTFGAAYSQGLGFTTDLIVLCNSILIGLSGTIGVLAAIFIGSLLHRPALVLIIALGSGVFAHFLSGFTSTELARDFIISLMNVTRFFFFNSGILWLSVLLLVIPIINWRRTGEQPFNSATLLLTICSITIGVRVLTKIMPYGYSIFYDTIAYLSWLVALYTLSSFLPVKPTEQVWKLFSILSCGGLILVTIPYYNNVRQRQFIISTPRGKIYTDQSTGKGYTKILTFLDSVKSEKFLTIPEDTSIYYFSSTFAPSRWHTLTPGILPPGELTSSYLHELDRVKVKYVILSNRSTPEYGVPIFGEDYNKSVYQWLDRNYTVIEQVGHYSRVAKPSHWGALVYQRKAN